MRHKYTRSESLKHLLSATIGRRSKETESKLVENASHREESQLVEPALDAKLAVKPSWRCFSYEEIHKAINGFHKDNLV
ncbi:putative receptor-like serine/threonine-protein kinase [Canna indica]|uniref:Receptor-like serine/threonine-protein kinase n=1 Tax=Canna indica TaxID=4628 RepID=A0AAQ3KMI3_9LILI|nr:putative receptor-like serine/threonine-protein kinase [Canna indica]